MHRPQHLFVSDEKVKIYTSKTMFACNVHTSMLNMYMCAAACCSLAHECTYASLFGTRMHVCEPLWHTNARIVCERVQHIHSRTRPHPLILACMYRHVTALICAWVVFGKQTRLSPLAPGQVCMCVGMCPAYLSVHFYHCLHNCAKETVTVSLILFPPSISAACVYLPRQSFTYVYERCGTCPWLVSP